MNVYGVSEDYYNSMYIILNIVLIIILIVNVNIKIYQIHLKHLNMIQIYII